MERRIHKYLYNCIVSYQIITLFQLDQSNTIYGALIMLLKGFGPCHYLVQVFKIKDIFDIIFVLWRKFLESIINCCVSGIILIIII